MDSFTDLESAVLTATSHGKAKDLLKGNRLIESIEELVREVRKHHTLDDRELVTLVIETIAQWRIQSS